jgi:L-threonylcarbamoyladenylate synthase
LSKKQKTLNARPNIKRIDSHTPQADVISDAAAIIKSGGVVAFPTRCLYGLGADAYNPDAVGLVFDIKQRRAQNPILVLIENLLQLEQLVKRIPDVASDLMARFWPGRITIVFEAKDTVPLILTAQSGKIGVRMPGHRAAQALVKAVQGPITGTSANLSGRPGCHHIDDLEPQIAGQLDLILDAGNLMGGKGSTIVDVSEGKPKILREGAISKQEIMNV